VAALIWQHALAVGYSPRYLSEHSQAILADWARVPLPRAAGSLQKSAALGRLVEALLDGERPPVGDAAAVMPDIAWPTRSDGGALLATLGDYSVTAGWGHGGGDEIVMPGRGRLVERRFEPSERTAIAARSGPAGIGEAEALTLFGENTLDIYLNDNAYLRCVPRPVWEYRIGGYQVIKKWLSYREQSVLGRALSIDELRTLRSMVQRLTGLVLLSHALDANYDAVRSAIWDWPARVAT
jgi:Type ISP C-terminal specificity domain